MNTIAYNESQSIHFIQVLSFNFIYSFLIIQTLTCNTIHSFKTLIAIPFIHTIIYNFMHPFPYILCLVALPYIHSIICNTIHSFLKLQDHNHTFIFIHYKTIYSFLKLQYHTIITIQFINLLSIQ